MGRRPRFNLMDVMIPSRLLCPNNDRKVFQNERGALLEISLHGRQGQETLARLVDGAPLPAYICDDDFYIPTKTTRIGSATNACFRTAASNDSRLHSYHYVRALLLTLMFAASLVSCDLVLKSYQAQIPYDHDRLSRRTQTSSLVGAAIEMIGG